jgi:Uma2 family endonuclease
MSTVTAEPIRIPEEGVKTYTPEDLLHMPDGSRYELIDGRLVERNISAESSHVAANLIWLVSNHVYPQKLGKVFATDCGYQIFPDEPNRVRYPDGSYIARARLTAAGLPKGHIRIAPDLAIEVVSPHDTAEEVETKRVSLMQAGTKLLWVVYPETRTVHVSRQTGNPSMLTDADVLNGEDVLPGFTCRVADLFDGA